MGDVITPIKRGLPHVVDFLKEIYQIWMSERPMQPPAALAYFGLFSFAPVIYLLFIRNFNLGSALEAAGSFVMLLSGFYYFAQIFLFGAIFTRVYAHRFGSLQKRNVTPSL